MVLAQLFMPLSASWSQLRPQPQKCVWNGRRVQRASRGGYGGRASEGMGKDGEAKATEREDRMTYRVISSTV